MLLLTIRLRVVGALVVGDGLEGGFEGVGDGHVSSFIGVLVAVGGGG